MNIIDIFLINGDLEHNVQGYFYKLFFSGRTALKDNTLLIFYESNSIINTIEKFSPETKYRVWIHLGIPSQLLNKSTLKESDVNAFFETSIFDEKGIKYNFITRNSKTQVDSLILKLQKLKPNFKGNVFPVVDAINAHLDPPDVEINEIPKQNNSVQNSQSLKNNQPASNIILSSEPNLPTIVVINALQQEQDPMFNIFKNVVKSDLLINKHKLNLRKLKNDNGKEIIIGFLRQDDMGMVDASILTSQAIEILKPKTIVMTGVCGGKPNNININYGDIIIPRQSFTFQFGKITESNKDDDSTIFNKSLQVSPCGNLITNFSGDLDSIISNVKNNVRKNKVLLTKIQQINKHEKEVHKIINIDNLNSHCAEDIACSTSVINKKGFFDDIIKENSRNAIAVEMESYGVARACQLSESGTKCLIIKSVMDKSEGKNDIYKEYAAFTSAYFFYELVKKGLI
ncbi:5'-methylthioadenosine/S-adenosylhomocysteine nucleosidase family protein [Emticicia agri]|uniref:Nucleoside phosphorylase domain-containing protein n=1 Tax=Emticicia agri TaxID=2492393 RepID=A0A4Q5LR06_9BACT|nr:hypothetical protein [Emticicia agri]RYU91783.1 hypothetical protein EWM59_26765 [Emticicia agri]